MSCRLASDLLHHPASYTPSVAARLRMSFYPTYHPIGYESWFGPPTHEPDSRSGAPGPPRCFAAAGVPNLTGLGLVADADERAEDKCVIW
ncbi:hypothetical protein RHS01_01028 [Rhizoctonia solani]|uniref:Uncharacterized protein n=1 Tax=Rhizoctonia solani TaxID=456999 RepID=A0A8H7ILG3_9AGAM|nr:hypothetical protein RHS01_01028 [Rhizoctonia solani]